jgi:hypothetical protein
VPHKNLVSSRCPACQLQLCKARTAAPHAGLNENSSDEMLRGQERAFLCQTCGITLVNSPDTTRPGWSHVR